MCLNTEFLSKLVAVHDGRDLASDLCLLCQLVCPHAPVISKTVQLAKQPQIFGLLAKVLKFLNRFRSIEILGGVL
jgi:hypothetical protein